MSAEPDSQRLALFQGTRTRTTLIEVSKLVTSPSEGHRSVSVERHSDFCQWFAAAIDDGYPTLRNLDRVLGGIQHEVLVGYRRPPVGTTTSRMVPVKVDAIVAALDISKSGTS